MFYVFHGPNDFLRAKAISQLRARLGAPEVLDLNVLTLDGAKITLPELMHVCDAIPFLSERRLVVVEGLAGRLTPGKRGNTRSLSEAAKRLLTDLLAYIQRLPPTTDLVLVEDEIMSRNHALHKLAHAQGTVRAFPMLRDSGLTRWIQQAAGEKGARLESAAVRELALYAGNNLNLLDLELDKLATFAGRDQLITTQDVRRLVSHVREESIFDLVDSLGRQDGARAMLVMHQLLEEGKEPLYILSMITRQFRLLLQIKALLDARAPQAQIMGVLRIGHAFVAEKMTAQARNFSAERLDAIFHDLQRIDVQIKTGQIDAELALDLFLADTCRPERRRLDVRVDAQSKGSAN